MSTETTETTMSPDASGAVDLGAAVRELGDRIALVKAVIAGADRHRVVVASVLAVVANSALARPILAALGLPYPPATFASAQGPAAGRAPVRRRFVARTTADAPGRRRRCADVDPTCAR